MAPSEALQFVNDNRDMVARPLRADSLIIMYHDHGLSSFCQSDNEVRLEESDYHHGPDWFLPNVKWVVLPFSRIDLAFLNWEDPRLQDFLANYNS